MLQHKYECLIFESYTFNSRDSFLSRLIRFCELYVTKPEEAGWSN